jgi:hypothetical protein
VDSALDVPDRRLTHKSISFQNYGPEETPGAVVK